MGRKAKEYNFSLINLGSNQDVINDAKNMSRWNPNLAIEWMEEILVKVVSPTELKAWNNSAMCINETIDSKEKNVKSYQHEEYWGAAVSRRLSIQAEELSLEDYAAMEAFKDL